MRRPGPALRVGLLGVAVALIGYALFAAWLGFHAERYLDARDRATATAVGVVVEDRIGDEGDIRVRWRDGAGREHVQRFGVYDVDRYAEDRPFPVAYDPGSADPRGFPADSDETAAEDDFLVPIALGAAVALLLTGVWALRGLRFVRTARRPGRPMTASVHLGRRPARWREPMTTWLRLEPSATEAGARAGTRWQRVMWHPALDDVTGPVPVTAHHAGPGRGPAVVTLPDGTRLVPLGRLREGPPVNVRFDDHEAVRDDLRDAFVLPAGTVVRPAGLWWHRGAFFATTGAVLGLATGLAFGATLIGAVAFALSGATLITSAWTLSSPQ
ncbi:hypothetical protein [Streptomyces sp. A012304]|uniref:hypothetical protein n=1 Tax=Streptomyces sp. A012304 TaxID=375446 RepID=UPI00223215CC|nr:hypothetical protein [Streptomyces sp. A012304]GKQ34326.1 hypothetical protein ALMP_08770 [Streptomyces sp. A012304]